LITVFLLSCAGAPEITSSHKPGIFLNKTDKISIIPSKIGGSDDIVLPDALETEFLKYGFNVIERTTVRQMVQENGLDFTEILNGEEYLKLGEVTSVRYIVLVNSRISGLGVSSATMKVIDLNDNGIIFSSTYTQPSPDNPNYINFENINDTAERMIKSLLPIVK